MELPPLRCSEAARPWAMGPVTLTPIVSLTTGTFEVSAEVSFRHRPLYLNTDCGGVTKELLLPFCILRTDSHRDKLLFETTQEA